MKPRKTIVIPDDDEPAKPLPREPFVAFVGGDSDERDVSKPVGYDANGNPLYAPRGILFRTPWS